MKLKQMAFCRMLTLGMFMTGGIAWAQTTLDSARKEGHVVFYASMETFHQSRCGPHRL
jgi:hypothetical protein